MSRVRGWALVTLPLAMLAGCASTGAGEGADTPSSTLIDDVAQEVAGQVAVSSAVSSSGAEPSSLDEQQPAGDETGGIGTVAPSPDAAATATTMAATVPSAVAESIAGTIAGAQDSPTSSTQSSVASASTTTATSTASTSTATSTSTSTTTTPALNVGSDLSSALDALTVTPEGARGGYDRDLFSHWVDADQNGCDARQDTLAAQVIGFPQVDLVDPCVIIEGDWYSVYDAVSYSGSPSELDVDHVVALAEAWDSGADAWSSSVRRRFANDPINLLAVTASSNRSKSDRDVGEWRPPARSSWCLTASMTISVKAAYSLSVDIAERNALTEMLATCGEAGQVAGVGDGLSSVATPLPTVPTTVESSAPSTTAAGVPAENCVDINTASIAELDLIVHIGESRAADIVALRPFASVSDLTRVSGIGDSRVADIIDQGLACVR